MSDHEYRRTVKDGVIRIENPEGDHWYWSEKLQKWLPSVTTITGMYPKGEGFSRWMGKQESYESSIEERDKAGERGTRIHKVAERILNGETVKFDEYHEESKLDIMTTASEWKMVEGFGNFLRDKKPTVLRVESRVLNEHDEYGGTVDCILKIDGVKFIVDMKTSSGLYFSHEMQIAAYRRALDMDDAMLALLHLKSKNKCGYQFKVLDSDVDLYGNFLACKKIWESFDGRDGPNVIEVQESVSFPSSEDE